ncbi:MAG: hypothetical protein IT357_01840 [Gemmatimonadaceae bacterium]|nr:hypothetical protein [Gemmatimonadaceae bacterium]
MTATILPPDESLRLVPELAATRNAKVWVYRFTEPSHGWTLSVATHAEPGSQKLSLGGFRIAPVERTSAPGFTTDREAIALAMGMEEKVHWSRVIGVGGPLAARDLSRVVGGKCVLAPSADARVGQPHDAALLDFAIASFLEIERSAGIRLTTGQDLGHGLMHDGKTTSLGYLNARYKGSVVADTSVPTGEGNYRILDGMLRASGVPLERATVALIGCGNIGMHIIGRLRSRGTTILACESRAERRAELEAMGIRTWTPEQKLALLKEPIDALVVNAAGGTLDRATVEACAANARLAVICGSENLVMPDASAVTVLERAHKVYAPTELGGMMGYLTAVEEYLAKDAGVPFDVQTLIEAAKKLDEAGFRATTRVREGGYAESFEQVITAIYGA